MYQVSCFRPHTVEQMEVQRTCVLAEVLWLVYLAGERHQEVLVHEKTSREPGGHGWRPVAQLGRQGRRLP